jgi:DNA-binding response OmpR family regulator
VPSVLVIAPGTPRSVEGRRLISDTTLTVDIVHDGAAALATVGAPRYDLLVLAHMSVDEQQQVAAAFQRERRWRLVPVLYLLDNETPGLAIPGSYRAELDSIVRGELDSLPVQRRMRAMAREGTGSAELVVAGVYELDPVRASLRLPGGDILLTEREAGILSVLLARPDRTVTAGEIIERGWGREPDLRYLQILRRHVSNIRRKLDNTPARRSLRTIRGTGYLFDTRTA